MKIDADLEVLVREALGRSVSGEKDKFEDALVALASDPKTAGSGLTLALAINEMALAIIDEGEPPSPERLRYLAHEFASTQEWTNVDEELALAFLTALVTQVPIADDVPVPGVFVAALAIGGWLLSSFKIEGCAHWNDFLDLVEYQLESLP